MAGAVEDLVPVARASEDGRGGAIDLPAPDIIASAAAFPHQRHRGVARVPDRAEGVKKPFRSIAELPRISHPGDIGIYRAFALEFAPEIEQHQRARADRPRRLGGRQVVRIAGVLVHRDIRRRIGDEPLVGKPSGHELLDLVLVRRAALADAPRDRVERLILDAMQLVGCLAVRRDLRVVPDGGETLDQIPRRDDRQAVAAALANELDRSGVHARDVRNRASGGVLHRHAAETRDEALQACFELLAARIALGRAGQVRERVRFNGVDKFARLAGGGNQVIPAARGQMAGLARDGGDVGGDRIDAAKVVEEPGVQPFRDKRGLHGRYIE